MIQLFWHQMLRMIKFFQHNSLWACPASSLPAPIVLGVYTAVRSRVGPFAARFAVQGTSKAGTRFSDTANAFRQGPSRSPFMFCFSNSKMLKTRHLSKPFIIYHYLSSISQLVKKVSAYFYTHQTTCCSIQTICRASSHAVQHGSLSYWYWFFWLLHYSAGPNPIVQACRSICIVWTDTTK